MLLAQTRQDRKETRAPFYTRIKYTVEYVFIEHRRDAVLSTLQNGCATHAERCCFVNLENGRMHAVAYLGQCAL